MNKESTGRLGSSSRRPHGKAKESTASNSGPNKPIYNSRKTPSASTKQQQLEIGSKNQNEEMDGADSDGAPPFGSDLYKDDDDKAYLEKLSELEREIILAERSTRWDDYRLKKMAKARSELSKLPTEGSSRSSRGTCMPIDNSPPPPVMAPVRASAGRTSARGIEKFAASQSALQELRARRMRHQDSEGYRNHLKHLFEDGFSNSERSAPVTYHSDVSLLNNGAMSDGDDQKDDELPEDLPLRNVDSLRFEDIRDVTIPRSRLLKWFMDPFFEDLLPGCFVRIGIYQHKDGSRKYRLYMVKTIDTSDPVKTYNFENYATHKYLILVSSTGTSDDKCKMTEASDSPPLEKEFKEWLQRAKSGGMQVPTLKALLEKKDEIRNALNFVYSAETVKQLIQDKKSASLRPSNMAAEKGRLRNDLVVARARNDVAEAERVIICLKKLEQMQADQADYKASRMVEINRRNRAENFKNASDLKPLNTELKAGDVGYDPFSRRWTRPKMFVYKMPVGEGSSSDANATAGAEEGGEKGADHVTAAVQEVAAEKGKLVDTRAPVDGNQSLHELHNFEVKVDLTKTFSLGSTPQERVLRGNMLRRQRQDRTIGRKVPDGDNNSHPFAISIEEYKRRRGMK